MELNVWSSSLDSLMASTISMIGQAKCSIEKMENSISEVQHKVSKHDELSVVNNYDTPPKTFVERVHTTEKMKIYLAASDRVTERLWWKMKEQIAVKERFLFSESDVSGRYKMAGTYERGDGSFKWSVLDLGDGKTLDVRDRKENILLGENDVSHGDSVNGTYDCGDRSLRESTPVKRDGKSSNEKQDACDREFVFGEDTVACRDLMKETCDSGDGGFKENVSFLGNAKASNGKPFGKSVLATGDCKALNGEQVTRDRESVYDTTNIGDTDLQSKIEVIGDGHFRKNGGKSKKYCSTDDGQLQCKKDTINEVISQCELGAKCDNISTSTKKKVMFRKLLKRCWGRVCS